MESVVGAPRGSALIFLVIDQCAFFKTRNPVAVMTQVCDGRPLIRVERLAHQVVGSALRALVERELAAAVVEIAQYRLGVSLVGNHEPSIGSAAGGCDTRDGLVLVKRAHSRVALGRSIRHRAACQASRLMSGSHEARSICVGQSHVCAVCHRANEASGVFAVKIAVCIAGVNANVAALNAAHQTASDHRATDGAAIVCSDERLVSYDRRGRAPVDGKARAVRDGTYQATGNRALDPDGLVSVFISGCKVCLLLQVNLAVVDTHAVAARKLAHEHTGRCAITAAYLSAGKPEVCKGKSCSARAGKQTSSGSISVLVVCGVDVEARYHSISRNFICSRYRLTVELSQAGVLDGLEQRQAVCVRTVKVRARFLITAIVCRRRCGFTVRADPVVLIGVFEVAKVDRRRTQRCACHTRADIGRGIEVLQVAAAGDICRALICNDSSSTVVVDMRAAVLIAIQRVIGVRVACC